MKISIRWGMSVLAAVLAMSLMSFGAQAQKAPTAEPAAKAATSKKKTKKKSAKKKTAKKTTGKKTTARKAATKKATKKAKAKAAPATVGAPAAAGTKVKKAKKAPSVCVGLTVAKCGSNTKCKWRKFKKKVDKNGRKLTPHCRLAGNKNAFKKKGTAKTATAKKAPKKVKAKAKRKTTKKKAAKKTN